MNENKFEREKVCYEQNCEQARGLNNQMNRVPVLAMTLTGGLWFAAGVTENLYPEIRFGLLVFSGFCNLALIAAALRIRDVFHSYLEKLEQFNPDSFANGKPTKAIVPAPNRLQHDRHLLCPNGESEVYSLSLGHWHSIGRSAAEHVLA